MRWRTMALLLGVVAGAGCLARPRTIPTVPARPLRTATPDEVLAAYEAHANGIETLSASGDLEVRDLRAGRARKLGVRLVASRGGKLYLKGSVAVVTAMEVVADGQRFWFQVPSRKTVWTGLSGVAHRAESDDAPYYALRPSDVTSALLPEPLAPGPGDAVLFEADRDSFALALAPQGARATARLRRARGAHRRGAARGVGERLPRTHPDRSPGGGVRGDPRLREGGPERPGAGAGLRSPHARRLQGRGSRMKDDAILKTEDLRMVYHVGTVEVFALRGVDIQVQKGEFVSIVGPSGCGKSTLLHLLGGLARPTYGRIFVDGDEISAAADADRTRIRREKIGFVFQRFNLLPTLTVKGNLEIACQIQGNGRPSTERVADVLDRVG